MTNLAQSWGEFITNVEYEDLPADVVHRMKRSLLEMLGVGIIGSRFEACRILFSYLKSAGGTYEIDRDPRFTELYTQDKFDNQRRRELARKVFARGDEGLTHLFGQEWPMRFGSDVEMKLRSGEVVTGDAEIWSVSANVSDDDVAQKFRDVAGRVLPNDWVGNLIDKVFSIDGRTTVGELVRAACL
jgi:2-methylcitrate dehydratase PrpD